MPTTITGRAWKAAGAALLATLTLWAAPRSATGEATATWTDVARVIAVGDVHGAYAPLVELLRETNLIDADMAWSGADAHLVSVGDLVDRGADGRRVLDLLMRLQREAEAAGGRVHVLMGNHELMNLIGDLRYVSVDDYAAFRDLEPAAARAAAWAAHADAAPDADPEALRADFDAAYPPGYFGRLAAFSAGGLYGDWLLDLPAVLVINDTAFVHGGLPPLIAEGGLGVNRRLRATLARYLALRGELSAQGLLPAFDRQRDSELARAVMDGAPAGSVRQLEEFVALSEAPELSLDGPLWYRGSIYCKPLLEEPILQQALDALGVSRAVVGHTPTPDRRVRALYDGRLIAVDTGMLVDYYQGRPAALLIEHGTPEVQYLSPVQRSSMEAGRAVAYGRNKAQLMEALAQGDVTDIEQGDEAMPWRVTVRYADSDLQALFYPRVSDRASDLELAAAALDELLGTGLVPPTVPRSIDGQAGALQLRYPDAVSEAARRARGLGFSGWCPIEPQAAAPLCFRSADAEYGSPRRQR
ncbi:MAG: metallophosphoesterase [bacterium]